MRELDEFGPSIVEMVKNAQVPFTAVYPDGKIMACNDAFCELLGYSREELDRASLPADLIPLECHGRMNEALEKLHLTKKPQRLVTEYLKKDGSRAPVDLFINLVCDKSGNVKCYYSFVTDLTERKRMEKALLDSEERLNVIIQGSPIPQFVIDKNHKVIYWNQALEQYSRIKASEIIGTKEHWKAFYSNERPCLADLLVDGALEEIPKWYPGKYSKSKLLDKAYEATNFFPALSEKGKWLYFTATVIADRQGNIIGAVETIEDITGRKHAEEQLQEAKRQAEMYLELMGHDINNMNQVCIGYLEMALQTLSLDEKVRYLIAKPFEALKDSSRLIANVEKLQRISSGEIRLERIDIGRMLEDVCDQYRDVPGREITIDYAPVKDHFVMANELLNDVFTNIIGNAVKHSTGPVTIGVKLDKVSEKGKEYYRIAIEDNGPGIPDELKARLFTRFQRGKTKAGGKGLGLYLVKSLVESFRGKVWAEDRITGDYAMGSRLVIMLPSANKGSR